MSRIAKNPIVLPQGVEVSLGQEQISVKGPLGSLQMPANPAVRIEQQGNTLVCNEVEGTVNANALSGTMRAVVANMVTGVSKGFEKKLTLVGVGFRAQASVNKLNLQIGYSHPVNFEMPAGVTVTTPTPTETIVKGANRQVIGQLAAEIRDARPPEPYKGKGIRYADERVVLKETKKK